MCYTVHKFRLRCGVDRFYSACIFVRYNEDIMFQTTRPEMERHSPFGAMAILLALAVLAFLFACWPEKAHAQTGAERVGVEIAKVATPTTIIVDSFVACFRATGLTKTCKDLAKAESERSKKVANEAADATKSSRPVVVVDGYGNFGGVYVSPGSSYVTGNSGVNVTPGGYVTPPNRPR